MGIRREVSLFGGEVEKSQLNKIKNGKTNQRIRPKQKKEKKSEPTIQSDATVKSMKKVVIMIADIFGRAFYVPDPVLRISVHNLISSPRQLH